jgi:hypothetical protein
MEWFSLLCAEKEKEEREKKQTKQWGWYAGSTTILMWNRID